MKTINMISQIVRLKQLVQRWRRRTPSAGSLAVYVGSTERRRFVIPTRYLNLPVFVSLLNKAEEEFGFQSGGLVLPCDVDFFQKLLNVLDRDERRFGGLDLDNLTAILFSDLAVDSSAPCKNVRVSDCRSFTSSLLQKAKV